MKKILLLSVLSLLVISACKKKEDNPSTTVTASFPKITLSQVYYSIPVGSARPVPAATAYDAFYNEVCKIVTVDSGVNNFVPGVYMGFLSAQNLYGFQTVDTYYVAVTNVSSAQDLSGHWIQAALSDSSSTNIVRLANGLYSTNNRNGVNIYTDSANVVSDVFVVTGATSIVFRSDGSTGTLGFIPIAGDTTMTYATPTGAVTFSR